MMINELKVKDDEMFGNWKLERRIKIQTINLQLIIHLC